ncbi:hypothetical protein D1871_23560 [Nakamurella silvestris]|nr:hypothetical protein D1871_23560 [Nakamurella silvestris]
MRPHRRPACTLLAAMLLPALLALGPLHPSAQAEFPPGTPADALPLALAWGDNTWGEIGDGTTAVRLTAVAVGPDALAGKEISAADAGSRHSCVISEGAAYCWGDNSSGQLGGGQPIDDALHPTPEHVTGPLAHRTVTAISAGGSHTCAVADGGVYCWGANAYGQLGRAGAGSNVPVAVDTTGVLAGRTVTAVSAGAFHTCAIADAIAFCWGLNTSGQLGDGLPTGSAVPVEVQHTGSVKGASATAVAAGNYHSCVLAEGAVSCWGDNGFGQLGIGGDIAQVTTPAAPVTGGALQGQRISSLAAGGYQTCVIAGAGRHPYCWGRGTDGALGDGSTTTSPLPVALATSGGLKDKPVGSIGIAAHGGCLVSGARGYCWGSNAVGQLGTGSVAPSSIPVPMTVPGTPLEGRVLLQVGVDWTHVTAVAGRASIYPDVPIDLPARDDVDRLSATGIAGPQLGGTFRPNDPVDRKTLAAWLFRSRYPGLPDPLCSPASSRRFTDVFTADPYCGVVEWLVMAGIVVAGGKFQPSHPVNRAAAATWFFRFHHPGVIDRVCSPKAQPFTDVAVAEDFCGDVRWVRDLGIMDGPGDGTFLPHHPVSRADAATFLHRISALTSH